MPIPSLAPTLKKRAPEASSRPAVPQRALLDPPPEDAAEGGHASRLPTHAKRSFLPQLGDLKHASRRPGTGDARDSTQSRPRPRSLYQSNTARTDEGHGTEKSQPGRHARLPSVADKSAAAQPASALRRAPSFRRTTATTPSTQPPASPRSHLRTQSTSTVTGTSAEPRTQKERPKSLFIPRSASVKVAEHSPVDATSSSSSTARLAALRRTASVRTRGEATPTSDSRGSTQRTGLSNVQSNALSSSRAREPLREEPKKQSRPAFSTLQKHFTPRKVGKALTSTFLHPSAPEVGANAIGPEMASIQAELLQLHLLHQASAETTRLWELSARHALERQFEEVKSLHQILRDEERQGQEQNNIRALQDWSMGSSSRGFAEHVQIISGPLQELPLLVDSGGRLQHLTQEFQQWIAHVENIWAVRDRERQMASGLESAEALGDAWKAENAALARKLTSFSRDLSGLTQPAPGSSVACVFTSCQQLVDGLLEELYTMQKIENYIVVREKDWVEESLKAIARGGGVSADYHESDVAWRA